MPSSASLDESGYLLNHHDREDQNTCILWLQKENYSISLHWIEVWQKGLQDTAMQPIVTRKAFIYIRSMVVSAISQKRSVTFAGRYRRSWEAKSESDCACTINSRRYL